MILARAVKQSNPLHLQNQPFHFFPCDAEIFTAFRLIFSILQSGGQTLSNLRSRYISLRQDSVQMDTLSLVPHSAYLLNSENKPLDTSAYILDEISGLLTWNKNSEEYKTIKADSIKVVYRVLSFRLDETLQHKSLKEIVKHPGKIPFIIIHLISSLTFQNIRTDPIRKYFKRNHFWKQSGCVCE